MNQSLGFRVTLAVLVTATVSACHARRQSDLQTPSAAAFTPGLIAYLNVRGDLCLGKNEFPIDVSEREVISGSRNALQMPALERGGLVLSSDAMSEGSEEEPPHHVRRYELTALGRQAYRAREVTTSDAKVVQQSDLCVAKLSLDRVVGWELGAGTPRTAVVEYTYRATRLPWAENPDILRVFPAVARVLGGVSRAQLSESFVLTQHGWVARELLPAGAVLADNAAPARP